MIADFLVINTLHIYLCTILIHNIYINDKKLYLILFLDVLFNEIPFITIIIVLIYYFNKFVFKIFNRNFINIYILILINYFMFGIVLYSIYNTFSVVIIKELIKHMPLNMIVYYFGLKYYEHKYNWVGESYERSTQNIS